MSACILVVEDNETNLELMVYLLKAFGYTLITAQDGAEGLAAVSSTRPDLIICDLVMPGIDGYEVGRRLKHSAEFRSIPLIAVTALAMVGEREKALAAGYDGYIPKPIDPETFVPQIERYLKPADVAKSGPSHAAPGQANQVRPAPDRQTTVLVVDDTPANLQLIRTMLEPFGYTVLTCGRCEEASGVLRSRRVDVVLCDLHMPDQNGYEFARAMRSDPQAARIPVLLITASSSGTRPSADLLAAAKLRFLMRPHDPEMLVNEIEACLNRPEAGSHGPDSDR